MKFRFLVVLRFVLLVICLNTFPALFLLLKPLKNVFLKLFLLSVKKRKMTYWMLSTVSLLSILLNSLLLREFLLLISKCVMLTVLFLLFLLPKLLRLLMVRRLVLLFGKLKMVLFLMLRLLLNLLMYPWIIEVVVSSVILGIIGLQEVTNEISSSWWSSFVWSRSYASLSWSSSWSFPALADWLQDVMLCRRPYMLGAMECPCGGCLPCRINRRRVWAHRILLETFKHGDSCFVTLTYSDDTVPDQLVKPHYQSWLKRLRKSVFPRKIRYFLAGEYGEVTGRPHFHAAIFGLDRLSAGGVDGREGLVKDTWPYGYTFVGELTWESAQYIAGYLTKKVVSDEKSVREFSKMSLRPGIGASAMDDVGQVLKTEISSGRAPLLEDVPLSLRHASKNLPLGRYLRRRLRVRLGGSGDTPPDVARLFVMQQAAEKTEARSALRQAGVKTWDAEKILLDTRFQKIKNLESRFKARDSQRRLK